MAKSQEIYKIFIVLEVNFNTNEKVSGGTLLANVHLQFNIFF